MDPKIGLDIINEVGQYSDIRGDKTPPYTHFDTVRRFKGLSRPCVFVIGLEGLRDPEIIYVATSRANVLLELAGSSDDIARVMCSVPNMRAHVDRIK